MPKCLCCGRDIPKGEQFVVERISKKSGKKRKENYCSEQEYDDLILLREQKQSVYDKIDYFFGYTVINTLLKREVENIFKTYQPSLVLSYLDSNSDTLYKAMGRTFDNEYCKIKYFLAILSNNIKDYRDIKKENEIITKKINTIEVEDIYNTKFKSKNRRKSLNDIDI